LNVVSTERGSIKKRNGSEPFITSPVHVELTTLAPVIVSGTRYLLAASKENLFSITSLGVITQIGEGFTSGYWSIVQAPKSREVPGEGPIYLSNGKDKAQYWTGAEAKTKVKEWTGINSSPKLTDGVLAAGSLTVKSETAGFVSTDVGLQIVFETAVKQKSGGTEIKEAKITSVNSSKEVHVEINAEGWEKEYAAVHFSLKRNYYEKAPFVPQGKYMIFAGNRIWMTGIEGDDSAVWFSEFVSIGEGGAEGDPSNWPRTNVIRFDPSDGKPITGIGTVGPYVLVFKETKVWAIHNLSTGENRKIADKVGCIAQRSIVETTGGTFFLSADQGVQLTNGSTIKEMSYNVRPTILKINPANRENAAAEYWNNHYYLSFPSGTSATNNLTLDYDAELKSWWLHDLAGNQWVRFEAAAGEPALFTIPPKTQEIAKVVYGKGIVRAFVEGIYTDASYAGGIQNYVGNGTLGAYWISPWEPFAYYIFRHRIKAPFLKKRVRQIFFNGEGQIVPVVYKNFNVGEKQEAAVVANKEIATDSELPVNFSAGAETFGEGEGLFGSEAEGGEVLFGGENTVGQARIYAPGIANVWSVGWGNNSAEPFVVHAFTYMIQFRKS
jgi:hypothetical protein